MNAWENTGTWAEVILAAQANGINLGLRFATDEDGLIAAHDQMAQEHDTIIVDRLAELFDIYIKRPY